MRIVGYDLARSLAIFGMIWVHFRIVMEVEKSGPGWLVWFGKIFEGRASATFVILAGIGMTLLASKAYKSNDEVLKKEKRKLLFKRAVFLFVAGLCYFPIWDGDILHAYGLYIAIGTVLLFSSGRTIWFLAFIANAIFFVLLLTLDYDQGWDWNNLEYSGFWSFPGFFRHIFFNGWNPVFPWVSFLFIGIWIGRLEVQKKAICAKLFVIGALTTVVAELLSWKLVTHFSQADFKMGKDLVDALFGTQSMPPLPLYMLSAGGTAVAVIALCLLIGHRFANSRLLAPFISTGQMALTLYISHVVIGIGGIILLGLDKGQDLYMALICTIVFSIAAIISCSLWQKHFGRGPLERFMRFVTKT